MYRNYLIEVYSIFLKSDCDNLLWMVMTYGRFMVTGKSQEILPSKIRTKQAYLTSSNTVLSPLKALPCILFPTESKQQNAKRIHTLTHSHTLQLIREETWNGNLLEQSPLSTLNRFRQFSPSLAANVSSNSMMKISQDGQGARKKPKAQITATPSFSTNGAPSAAQIDQSLKPRSTHITRQLLLCQHRWSIHIDTQPLLLRHRPSTPTHLAAQFYPLL